VAPKRTRIELDEPGARALHAALTAALAAGVLDGDQTAAARGVLEQLDRRMPDWAPEEPEHAVLAALAEAEAEGRGALAEEELADVLGAGGASVRALLDRMAKERLLQRTERDGRTWLAASPAGRRRHAAPRAEAVTEPEALVDLLYAERRPGRWAHRPSVQAIGRLDDAAFEVLARRLRTQGLLEPGDSDELELTDAGAELARERWAARSPTPHWRIPPPALPYRPLPVEATAADRRCPSSECTGSVSARSATWKALLRDGSVEWTCPQCSRSWLIYLLAYDDGAPAYRDPVEGDHNRPHWRSSR
jgi:Mn-dependent DtxR family transcriptional regulator